MRALFLLLTFGLLFLSRASLAQVAGTDLPFLSSYKEEIPYFQELITGGQYAEPSPLIKGDPYYYSRQFETGSLRINGITYPEVPLRYDIFRDQLVTFHPVFNQKILIKPEKIDGFALGSGEEFRYFKGNEGYLHHGNGFYQLVGQGKAEALVKRYKNSKSLRELSRFDEEYVDKADYFIRKGGVFSLINKGSQAISALGLSTKETKKDLKTKGLNFSRNPEAFLKFLVNQTQLP